MATFRRLVTIATIFVFCYAVLAADDSEKVTKKFEKLLEDFWEWRLKNSPEFATQTGVNRYNDKMEEMTIKSFERRNKDAIRFLERLNKLGRDEIEPEQLTNYDLLKDNLSTFVDGYEWIEFTYSMVSFMEGPHHGIPKIIKMMPFNDEKDFKTYIKRLEAFADQVEQYIDLMRESVKTGLTLHKASVKLIPDEIKVMLRDHPNTTEYYMPFAVDINMVGLEEKTVAKLKKRGEEVIRDRLFVAFKNLGDYIEKEYLPKTRPGIGISSLPRGAEFYKAVLTWHLSFDMTPEEVHQLGLEEVDRIESDMKKVMREVNYTKSTELKDFIEHLQNQTEFFYGTEEELLQGYRDIIEKRIRPVIPEYFNNPPSLPIEVVGSKTGASAAYLRGTADGKTPGKLTVNTRHPETKPKFDMMALALHEVDPGHHMQVGYMLTGNMPPFRQHTEYSKYHAIPNHFPFYTAYTEGWGLYSEYVGEEMGMYKTPYERFGRYVSEMLRACRLVVDTGIHAKNWTYQRAEDYMVAHLTDPIHAIRSELDRYITLPGQACAYKVGEQRILQLRRQAETKLGDKFNVKSFHDPVLTHGSLPLSLLEQFLNEWSTEVSGATTVKHSYCITLVAASLTIIKLFKF